MGTRIRPGGPSASALAQSAELRAAFAPLAAGLNRGDRTLSFIGDSITEANVSNNTHGNLASSIASFAGNSWVGQAALRADGIWRYRSVRATAGYTPSQIRATHLPGAIADNPWACVVLAGTNSETTTAASITELTAIYAALEAAGIHPILCTIPPRAQATYEATLNTFIRRYARDHGHLLVDFHTPLLDTATQAFAAGLTLDGIHPNAAGAAVMGETFAAVLRTALAGRNYAPTLDHTADGATLVPNATFMGGTNADTSPVGWVLQTARGTSTIALATDAAVRGRKVVMTVGDSTLNVRSNHVTLVAGRRYLVAYRVRFPTIGSGGSVSFQLEETSVGSLKLASWLSLAVPLTDWRTVYFEFVMPTGLSSYSWRMKLQAVGSGTVLEVGEFTWLDLTALGLVTA